MITIKRARFTVGFNDLFFQNQQGVAVKVYGNQSGIYANWVEMPIGFKPILECQYENGLSEHGEIFEYSTVPTVGGRYEPTDEPSLRTMIEPEESWDEYWDRVSETVDSDEVEGLI